MRARKWPVLLFPSLPRQAPSKSTDHKIAKNLAPSASETQRAKDKRTAASATGLQVVRCSLVRDITVEALDTPVHRQRRVKEEVRPERDEGCD